MALSLSDENKRFVLGQMSHSNRAWFGLAKKPPTGLNEERWLVLMRPSLAGFDSTFDSRHIDETLTA
jgi:hypothetical protein